jgi:hypothetical protein
MSPSIQKEHRDADEVSKMFHPINLHWYCQTRRLFLIPFEDPSSPSGADEAHFL